MPRSVRKKSRRARQPKRIGRAARVPNITPGRYADGLPFDEVQYLECKIILRPNHFTSRKSFFDFAKVIRRPAEEADVDFSIDGSAGMPLQIREVEPLRLLRRLQELRGWSHGETESVFGRDAGASRADGARAPWGARVAVGGDLLDRGEDRLYCGDAAEVGSA